MTRIDSLSVKLIWRGLCARFVSLKLLKSSKTKRLRPQNGARLRALREQQNLRQSAFADQINAYMRKLIPNCLDPSDHKLYKFGKLYRARQVLRSLMTDRNTIDEHS